MSMSQGWASDGSSWMVYVIPFSRNKRRALHPPPSQFVGPQGVPADHEGLPVRPDGPRRLQQFIVRARGRRVAVEHGARDKAFVGGWVPVHGAGEARRKSRVSG